MGVAASTHITTGTYILSSFYVSHLSDCFLYVHHLPYFLYLLWGIILKEIKFKCSLLFVYEFVLYIDPVFHIFH